MTSNDVSYGSNKKAWWICSLCDHEWLTTICDRTKGQGCPACADRQKESKMATKCKQYFKEKYNAVCEYKLFKNPKTNKWLKCDIYIPNKNVFIEVHGEQHYKYNSYFFKSQKEFEYRQCLDKIKKSYCQETGWYIEIDLRKIKTIENIIIFIERKLKLCT